jgi:hypothetical protein
MKQTIIASVLLALLALGIFSASGQAPAKPRGVLAVLHIGQSVTLKETPAGYEISVFQNGPDLLGHKVVEVGGDFVVVQDVSGVNEVRIPIYAVKAIVTLKVPK